MPMMVEESELLRFKSSNLSVALQRPAVEYVIWQGWMYEHPAIIFETNQMSIE